MFSKIRQLKSFLRRHRREAEMLALGVFLSGLGILGSLILSTRDNQGIEIINSGSGATGSGENSRPRENGPGGLLADVAGAVINPGVYRLPVNSRFADALAAAGGLAAGADRNWVSRHLNLAQNITDGVKIYIPAVGESDVGGQKSESPTSDFQPLTSEVQISINTANLNELDILWGVGEARAQAVIAGRPYASIEELVSRKILPQNVVERNKDRLEL
jgi:competence protein ComEA